MTTTDGNQYSFMQGGIKVLSVKTSSPASLFGVEAHDEWVHVTGLDKLSRSACAVNAGTCRAFADPCTRVSPYGKGACLAVLLRIKRKLMNIDCRWLKSCAAMTAWWGLMVISAVCYIYNTAFSTCDCISAYTHDLVCQVKFFFLLSTFFLPTEVIVTYCYQT